MNNNNLKQDELLDTARQKPVDPGNPVTADEDNECRKSEMVCPHCKETITEIRYQEYGRLHFQNGNEDGGDADFPERTYSCPECNSEIERSVLQDAGVLP
jgi:transposase